MKIETLVTSEELKSARVSQAYFGRVAGISRMRVSQLAKAGLILVDDAGVLLMASLERLIAYREQKGCDTVEKFVWRQNQK